jgi:hypothetical protein
MGISVGLGSAGSRPGVCTSSTRPTAPYEGQVIYETDTDRILVWDGSVWERIVILDSLNRAVFPGSATFVTETAAGRGVGIAAPPGDASSAILQFTNNAVSSQWGSITANSSGEVTINGRILNTSVNVVKGTPFATTVNTATPTNIATVSLTVKGSRPVLVMASGDANPSTNDNAWNHLRLYRNETTIGPYSIQQASGPSNNQAFAVVALDQSPSAGTYTYSLRAWNGDGPLTYGEGGADQGPQIIALELL